MLQFIRKNMIGRPLERLRSRRGQAAVVIILVIAVALILYAVVLNMNRLSQVKNQTIISSNLTASQLASTMASYGESVLRTTLGGRTEKCGFTAVLAIIIVIVIIIIAIVLAPFTVGGSLSLLGSIPAVLIGLALLIVSLILQLAVVQPGLTEQWNRMMADQLLPLDSFVERGIQAGLGSIVTDQKMVPDLYDLDGDGVYIDPGLGLENDFISRFGIYYTERLKRIEPRASTDVTFFLTALSQLLLKESPIDNFGFWDRPPNTHPCGDFDNNNSNSPNKPSHCDPCCVPVTFNTEAIRPACCDHPNPNERCGSAANCGNRTGTGWADPFPSSGYNFLFETIYPDDETNGFFSFREALGRDDEHRDYTKNFLNPNGPQSLAVGSGFILPDTTGYFRDPTVTPSTDNKTGIYSFFHKMADWVPRMYTSSAGDPLVCHWCDATSPVTCSVPEPLELPRPTIFTPPPALSGGLCVERDNVVGQKPLRPDNVSITNYVQTIGRWYVPNDNYCADDITTSLWKRGGDRYCGASWPHAGNCPKHSAGGSNACDASHPEYPYNCTCEDSADFTLWPEDTIDAIVYGIPDFINLAHSLLQQDPISLGDRLPEWYPSVAQWIEPALSYSGFPEDGYLHKWLDTIEALRDSFASFLDDPSYEDASWGDTTNNPATAAWCYPDLTLRHNPPGVIDPPKYMSREEHDFIDSGGGIPNPRRIDKVIACLDWNANAPANPLAPITERGNAWRFFRCANPLDPFGSLVFCVLNWSNVCSQLPRSLLPFSQFDQTNVQPAFTNIAIDIFTCQTTCGIQPACDNVALLVAGTPWNPAWCLPDAEGDPWGPNHLVYDFLTNLLVLAAGSCADVSPGGWRDDVWNSAVAAVNQVEKMRKRLSFLQGFANPNTPPPTQLGGAYSLVDSAKEAWTELDAAFREIDDFLENEAQQLTDLIANWGASDPPLPSQAVYIWKSEPPSSRWHIVRVDVRIPQRCGSTNACGPGGNAPDSVWPWVSSRTISWGTRRCFSLEGRRGSVKARVTRFDENAAPGLLTFPSGEKIWDFKFYNPLSPAPVNVNDRLTADCLGGSGCDLELSTPLDAREAFIIGSPDDCRAGGTACSGQCFNCWNTVNDILRSGITTETCAEYFFKEGGHGGNQFNIKFIKCKNFD